VLLIVTVAASSGYWRARDRVETGAALAFAEPLANATRPHEEPLVVGLHGWSPDVLYYARRRGLTLEDGFIGTDLLHRQRDRYRVLLSANPSEDRLPEVLSEWPWIGVLGNRLYTMGDDPEEIPGAVISASDDVSALASARRAGTSLRSRPLTIRCGQETARVPAGASGTWLGVGAGRTASLVIDALSLGPIPARAVVAVAPRRGNRLTIDCAGAEAVTIMDVIDAAPPVRCQPPRPARWPDCARRHIPLP